LLLMVAMTAAVGYFLASPGTVQWPALSTMLAGVILAAGGANAFNEWIERELDARMKRTQSRPLPSRRISTTSAAITAWVMTLGGGVILLSYAGVLAAALTMANVGLYACVYTPLKRRSSACTLVGAVVGAMPPMIGWVAASGSIDAGAWVLSTLLFTWQIPHFLSLAWIHREDYARAGFRMLPVTDSAGRLTFLLILLYCLALMPVALSASIFGIAGTLYALGSSILGTVMALLGGRLMLRRTHASARQVFLASLVYLPALLGLMLLDQNML